MTCECCGKCFDIECAGVTRTLFKATNDNSNWSWKCNECRFSSYRILTNNLKELTMVVNLLRNDIDFLKKASDCRNNQPDNAINDPFRNIQSTNKAIVTNANPKSKQPVTKSTVQTRSSRNTVVNDSTPEPSEELPAASIVLNDDVLFQAAETPARKWLYLTNLKPSTTVENVKSFLCSKLNINVDALVVIKLVKKGIDISHLTFTSFKIAFNTIMDPSHVEMFLPPNVRISEFVDRNASAINPKN